jgi:hypothetical protein
VLSVLPACYQGLRDPLYPFDVPDATFSRMTRAELHRLVDELPDESVDAAGILLSRAKDPMLAALEAALFDDEPYTGEDRTASDEGWAAYQRGEAISVAELRAEPQADA